jgi:hypothetical protein
MGISTFVCLLFLDRCLFNSNLHAGIIAHTREDAEVMFRRVKFAYDSLPAELKVLRIVNTDNARELKKSLKISSESSNSYKILNKQIPLLRLMDRYFVYSIDLL